MKYKTGWSGSGQTSDPFILHFSVQDRSTMLKQRRRPKKRLTTHHNLFYGLVFKSDLQGKNSSEESQKLFQRHYCTGSLVVD